MAKKHTYEAVFPSGEKINRTTTREYAYAWRVFNSAGQTILSGFSKARQGAEREGASFARYDDRKYETAPAVIVSHDARAHRQERIAGRPFRIERTSIKTGHTRFVETGGNRHARFATREEALAEIVRLVNQMSSAEAEHYSFKVTVK